MKAEKTDWLLLSMLTRIYVKGRRKLVIVIHNLPGVSKVLALESSGDTLEAVLESHAHQLVGTSRTLDAAKRLADRYAQAWAARRVAKRCGCKTIEKPVRLHVVEGGR